MSTPRLLIVDDEPFNLEIIAEYLEETGYELTLASGGEDALRLLRDPANLFDLVLLDRMMPGIDGMEVLRSIKQDERLRDTPVIMQTAASGPEQVAEGLKSGAYYYLTKPFEPDALLSIVRGAMSDLRSRRELGVMVQEYCNALRLVDSAEFRIRTLEEARVLSAFVAQLAEVPGTAALGLSELLINGIEHGNLGISFSEKTRLKEEDNWSQEIHRRLELPEFRNKHVLMQLQRVPAGWKIVIHDEGQGFDWSPFLEFDPERAFAPNGRGIALSRQLAFASMEYIGNGNTVQVVMPAGNTALSETYSPPVCG